MQENIMIDKVDSSDMVPVQHTSQRSECKMSLFCVAVVGQMNQKKIVVSCVNNIFYPSFPMVISMCNPYTYLKPILHQYESIRLS